MKMQLALALFLLLAPHAALAETVPVTKTEDAARPARPPRADGGLTKAEDQLAEGKYMQALETLGGVLQRRPGDADALAYAAYAWMNLGEAEKAVDHAARALRADPGHMGANAVRAELYLDAGDSARALEQLQALRLACGGADCPELDRLQSLMNRKRRAGE